MIWRFTAVILSSFCLFPFRGIANEDAVFYGQELLWEGRYSTYELKGEATFLFQDYSIQAERMVWNAEQKILTASGQVRLFTPKFDIQAQAIRIDIPQSMVTVESGQIHYLKRITLDVRQATLTPNWIHADGATLSLIGTNYDWPLRVKTTQIDIFPQLWKNNLRLTGVQILEGISLPYLELSIPLEGWPESLPLESQTFNTIITPQFQWREGILDAGIRLRLLDDSNQRFYLASGYRTDMGWQQGFLHEWRPTPEWFIRSDWHFPLRGQQQVFFQSSDGDLLQMEMVVNERSRLENLFPLQLTETNVSWSPAISFFSSYRPLGSLPLNYRYRLGGAFSPETQWKWGGGLNLLTHPLPVLPNSYFQFSSDLAYLGTWPEHMFAFGGRILYVTQWTPQIQYGTYLEKLTTTLAPEKQGRPEQVLPRWGNYWIINWTPELATGLLLELAPFHFTSADLLVSYRLSPLTAHMLLQGIPLGLQLRLEADLF